MYLTQDYIDIIVLFNRYKVRYLIAGAYAMSKIGYSRSTYDIDIWVEKSKENATNIKKALEEFGIPFTISADDFLSPNSVIQIGIEHILTDIDALTFKQAWQNKEVVFFDDLRTYTLNIEDIITNKKASNRKKDKYDVVELEKLKKTKKNPKS